MFRLIAPVACSSNPTSAFPDIPRCWLSATSPHSQTKTARCSPESQRSPSSKGDWAADTIARDLKNQPRRNFRYHDKGSLATIGRAAAVAQFGGKFELSGYFAWLAWLFIHILFLIGFRNRLIVMIQWAWSYLTYERGARLITGSDELPGWTEPQENGGATGVSPVHPGADTALSTSTPDAAAVTVTPPLH